MGAGSNTGDFDMANIGIFTRTADGFTGTVRTLTLNVKTNTMLDNAGLKALLSEKW